MSYSVKCASKASAGPALAQDSLEYFECRFYKMGIAVLERHRALQVIHIPDHVDGHVNIDGMDEFLVGVRSATTTNPIK